ncbi:hypothetical protein ACIRP7_28405 [Streptomyces sp. NPDC102270]|uniref:hypothetical protein n=1 Tax=Streptomyces sp. NPDC102270 TaxID=3366150 RepID=UPI0037F3F1A5
MPDVAKLSNEPEAYASRRNRVYLRRRGIRCTIPDKADQARNRQKLGSRRRLV